MIDEYRYLLSLCCRWCLVGQIPCDNKGV